jgi:membrane protein
MAEPMRNFVQGRTAVSPRQIPWSGWWQVLKRAWNETWIDNIALVAAGVAFYGFLALVPLLAAIVLLWGLAAEPQTIVETLRTVFAILPRDIATFIGDQLVGVVRTSEEKKGLGLAIALLVALYGTSNGAWALITALNIAYEEDEKRSWWRVYLLTFVIAFGAIVVSLIGIGATIGVSALERLLPQAPGWLISLGRVGAYVLLALAAAACAATLYRWGPSREHARWRWITPGSALSAVMWVILSAIFGFYAARIGNFGATYGSLGAIAGFLTWLYLSAYAFLFGAELNCELEHQTAKDSTTGPPERMGERGAWAADHVAGEPEDGKLTDGPSLASASPGAPATRESEESENP